MKVEKNDTYANKIAVRSCRQLPSQPPAQTTNDLWAQYSELAAHGIYCIGAWLKRFGFKRIVVACKPVELYGMGFQFGTLDKLVISELKASDEVELVGLITQTMTTLGNIPIVSISSVNADPTIDAVIVPEPGVYESALYHFGERVVFLEKIIQDIYWCQMKLMPLLRKLNDLQKKGHQTLFVCTPCAEDVKNPSVWEDFIVRNQIIAGSFGQELFPQAFELSGLNQKYASLAEYDAAIASNVTRAYGFVVQKNYYIEKMTIDGQVVKSRHVTGCPSNYEKTVYMFGNSAVAGIGLEERDSSPSALQALLNNSGKAFRVLNLGVDGQDVCQLAYRMEDSQIEPNSIVVVVMCMPEEMQIRLKTIFQENHIPFCAAIEHFQRPHQFGEVFLNAHHLNHIGNKQIAELIYKELFSLSRCAEESPVHKVECYRALQTRPEILEEYYDPIAQSKEFQTYIQGLVRERKHGLSKIGAIVMNCNPFTLGHQYLIELCASKTDWLYVFVVEEDKSVFPFMDRLKLVKQGVKHIPNVSVFPSGSFMISTLTFPEYFRKDDLKELAIDPSKDVELFGKYIAPALGITVRFAGEEPLDAVTAQYNAAMERLLPQCGIEFCVIKRKESDGKVISASRVRALLKQGDFSAIEKLVPKSTMEYLVEKYLPRTIANITPDNSDQMMSQLLDMVSAGKYAHMPCLTACLQMLGSGNPLLAGIDNLEFIQCYRDLYWMLWQERNDTVLDIMTGMLLDNNIDAAEEVFLVVYLHLAAFQNQVSAFLYGNIRLAYFYFDEKRFEDCRGIVSDLEEMGAGEHDEVLALQRKLESI